MRGRFIRYEPGHRCAPPSWWERFGNNVSLWDEWVCPECGLRWRWEWVNGSSSMRKFWKDTNRFEPEPTVFEKEAT